MKISRELNGNDKNLLWSGFSIFHQFFLDHGRKLKEFSMIKARLKL